VLAEMFARARIDVDKDENGKPIVIGVALKEPESRALVPVV
jgi:hypothetical protein